jgi:hypothetical protein
MVGDGGEAQPQHVRHRLSSLHEQRAEVYQLARVVAEDVHADDDMRRRPLDNQLEGGARQRHGGRTARVAAQVLALSLRAHGVHVAANGRRVAANSLDDIEVVRRPLGCLVREADEGKLWDGPYAHGVARRIAEEGLRGATLALEALGVQVAEDGLDHRLRLRDPG